MRQVLVPVRYDDQRASGMVRALMAHRTGSELGEPATAARADHEQVFMGPVALESGCWSGVVDDAVDPHIAPHR